MDFVIHVKLKKYIMSKILTETEIASMNQILSTIGELIVNSNQ
jgi:hypothetical protein